MRTCDRASVFLVIIILCVDSFVVGEIYIVAVGISSQLCWVLSAFSCSSPILNISHGINYLKFQ
jgi:hypothetical protein